MDSRATQLFTELEVKSLLIRERYYRDTSQWDKLRNSYHPDPSTTSIKITWFEGNIDRFISGSKEMTKRGVRAAHTIQPVEVHVNGDKAVSESTGSISIRFALDGGDYDCVSYTRFLSRLQRVDGEWKILTLEAVYERDTIVPVTPSMENTQFVSPGGRESYRWIGWLLDRKGFQIDPNLPGIDRPASVSKLIGNCWSWIERMRSEK
ncbi:unnamed protein product [Penicillium pancosmium]